MGNYVAMQYVAAKLLLVSAFSSKLPYFTVFHLRTVTFTEHVITGWQRMVVL